MWCSPFWSYNFYPILSHFISFFLLMAFTAFSCFLTLNSDWNHFKTCFSFPLMHGFVHFASIVKYEEPWILWEETSSHYSEWLKYCVIGTRKLCYLFHNIVHTTLLVANCKHYNNKKVKRITRFPNRQNQSLRQDKGTQNKKTSHKTFNHFVKPRYDTSGKFL